MSSTGFLLLLWGVNLLLLVLLGVFVRELVLVLRQDHADARAEATSVVGSFAPVGGATTDPAWVELCPRCGFDASGRQGHRIKLVRGPRTGSVVPCTVSTARRGVPVAVAPEPAVTGRRQPAAGRA